MNLPKKIYSLLIIIVPFFACESDNICLEDITPKMIIKFYDAANRDKLKSVVNLKVQIEGVDGYFGTEIIALATDSIAIPLKVTDDLTRFILTISSNDDSVIDENKDILDVNYIRQDEFISRSCGYKTLFLEITTLLEEDADNWIKSIETYDDPQNILNEKTAHVKIFH